MTLPSPVRPRRGSLGQAVIPIALLALLGLIGGLTVHARSMESSHRKTAERALRDYAAFAAWQFSSEAAGWVRQTARVTLHVLDPLLRSGGTTAQLPPPATLVRWGDSTACGIGRAARYAFRFATKRHRKRITVFHKANIMKLTDGLFLNSARRIHEDEYPNIDYEEVMRSKIIVGTPSMVVDRLGQIKEELGLSGILAELNCGMRIPHHQVVNSLNLMCQEVRPKFQ